MAIVPIHDIIKMMDKLLWIDLSNKKTTSMEQTRKFIEKHWILESTNNKLQSIKPETDNILAKFCPK